MWWVPRPCRGTQHATTTRLLGPFDLFLQVRDRAALVSGTAHAKELWPVPGRPGAVPVDGELVGSWRPRKAGNTLTVAVQPWQKLSATTRDNIGEQAERFAAYLGIPLADVKFAT
ncbi:crosslink repair DNA glycosylase YcaQ family protein [Micromonospora sp. NPDC005367]|uniref:DNA glycosylase AlkZ-like family protein n=1 Tax=Micromonospora sp. NPDC005367 TaxID=3155590 RepID=UPI0033B1BBC0